VAASRVLFDTRGAAALHNWGRTWLTQTASPTKTKKYADTGSCRQEADPDVVGPR
jgi:hypothetical protein